MTGHIFTKLAFLDFGACYDTQYGLDRMSHLFECWRRLRLLEQLGLTGALLWSYQRYMYFTSRIFIPKLLEWNRSIFWHWWLRQVCKYWPYDLDSGEDERFIPQRKFKNMIFFKIFIDFTSYFQLKGFIFP